MAWSTCVWARTFLYGLEHSCVVWSIPVCPGALPCGLEHSSVAWSTYMWARVFLYSLVHSCVAWNIHEEEATQAKHTEAKPQPHPHTPLSLPKLSQVALALRAPLLVGTLRALGTTSCTVLFWLLGGEDRLPRLALMWVWDWVKSMSSVPASPCPPLLCIFPLLLFVSVSPLASPFS